MLLSAPDVDATVTSGRCNPIRWPAAPSSMGVGRLLVIWFHFVLGGGQICARYGGQGQSILYSPGNRADFIRGSVSTGTGLRSLLTYRPRTF
jgi:hypothetical protein